MAQHMEQNKQETAVEWLYQKLSTASSEELVGSINAWFDFAKIIEKEQIMHAYIDGEHQQGYVGESEQYYNETYGE
jgi:hypothetical protein